MIRSFRNSRFMRAISFLMAISIFTVSCDPEGDLTNNALMDKEIEKQIEAMSSIYTPAQCGEARVQLQRAKSYVLSRSKLGMVSRENLLNYMIDEAVANGEIESISQQERDLVVSTFKENAYFLNSSSLSPVFENMKIKGTISESEMNVLISLEERLADVTTESEAVDAFNELRADMQSFTNVSNNFTQALSMGLDQAELAMCANMLDGETQYNDTQVQQRCEILQCVTEYTWVVQLITVVIAVVAIILAIFTFGFSLLLVSITFAACVLVPVLVCSLIPCPDEPCPDGQELVCHPNFQLLENGLCFAEGFSIIGDGLFSQPTNGTNCPAGSFYAGSFVGCAWGPLTTGIFSGLVDGEDYWADGTGAFHRPVCN